jgi:hypothetical protein
MAHFRESPLFPWYSTSRPSFVNVLIATAISTGLLIIIVGKIIGDGYDADSKTRASSSSRSERSGGERSSSDTWLQDEYTKRKGESETPELTIARAGKEKLEWDTKNAKRSPDDTKRLEEKRRKEVQKLKEMLKKKSLPLVGLDVWEHSGAAEVKVTKTEVKVEEKGKDGRELKGWERFLLGKKKTGGTKEEKRKVTVMEPPKEGPGWKISDEHVTQMAMAQQTSRAEGLAKSMKAG